MITGAHSVIFSKDAEADRAFLRDVLGLSGVDAGDGWLIFALPPSEVAVHPADHNDVHELYFLTDDVARFVARLKKRRVACGAVQEMAWGLLTHVRLPGGGALGVYEPRHARPGTARTRRSRPAARRK